MKVPVVPVDRKALYMIHNSLGKKTGETWPRDKGRGYPVNNMKVPVVPVDMRALDLIHNSLGKKSGETWTREKFRSYPDIKMNLLSLLVHHNSFIQIVLTISA